MLFRHSRRHNGIAASAVFSDGSRSPELQQTAVQVRVAQPALSRQVQDLEDEIGVDLLRRSPRGVTLTAEGKLFLEEVRELLKRADRAVDRVRARPAANWASCTSDTRHLPRWKFFRPPWFQKTAPRVKVILHDLAGDELIEGLLNGTLELAVMGKHTDEAATGIEFEELRRYSYCVAMARRNPLARKKSFSVEQVAKEPLVGLRRRDYTEYHRILDRLFAPRRRALPLSSNVTARVRCSPNWKPAITLPSSTNCSAASPADDWSIVHRRTRRNHRLSGLRPPPRGT
jgi:DNA-binding transcriptional LysR family regulator